jgi:hypothetical protein
MGAPQVTIETITVTRPLKVIAFTCCAFTVILMVAATSTSDWMNTDGWREGLFSQCVGPNGVTPVPFAESRDSNAPGCYRGRGTSYLRGAAALVIIGLFTDFFGTFLCALGLRSTDPNKKYKYYRVSIYALIVAVIALLLAAIIYPVQFSKDMHEEDEVAPLDGGGWNELNKDSDGDVDDDGIPDVDDEDDDGDGLNDDVDPDDDGDGVPDTEDGDSDGDGIQNEDDEDDDGDGILDVNDEDDDGDGIDDEDDIDDDNDGKSDAEEEEGDEPAPTDAAADEDEDTDDDGLDDDEDPDDDNDGIDDDEDTDDDGDGILDVNDPDHEDDDEDDGKARVFSFGFGYGATWGSIVLIFASVVLLICDRESEEIYYKEKQVEEDEEEEGGDA